MRRGSTRSRRVGITIVGPAPSCGCHAARATSFVPLLQYFLELRRHRWMAVAAGRFDARAVGGARLLLAAQLAQRTAQSAPRVALVVGRVQIRAQLLCRALPVTRAFVLRGEAEAHPDIARVTLQHPAE